MAEGVIAVTDADIDTALERAKELDDEFERCLQSTSRTGICSWSS